MKIVQYPKKFICDFIKALISLFDLQSYEKKRKNLEIFFDFSISSAESMPMIEDNSVVLVTAGRAIQYFDFEKFFQDCNRILQPGQIWLLQCLHTYIFSRVHSINLLVSMIQCWPSLAWAMKARKMLSFSARLGLFFRNLNALAQWAWQGLTIFVLVFNKKSADKIWFRKAKEIKVSHLMPIRVKEHLF